jgi:hypothetical protein
LLRPRQNYLFHTKQNASAGMVTKCLDLQHATFKKYYLRKIIYFEVASVTK